MGRNEISLSHLFYAIDVLLFTNGTENSLKNLMTLLHEYEKSSVQLISQGKSGFNLHDKFQRRALIIARATVLNQKA